MAVSKAVSSELPPEPRWLKRDSHLEETRVHRPELFLGIGKAAWKTMDFTQENDGKKQENHRFLPGKRMVSLAVLCGFALKV